MKNYGTVTDEKDVTTKKYVDDGLAGKSDTGHTHTPASIGAAAEDHTHTAAEVGAAEISHNHSASNITSGTLPLARGGTGSSSSSAALTALGALPKAGGTMTGTLKVPNGTDYTTYRVRNIAISTTASTPANGDILGVYS